jgi:hypothetical protein
MPIHIERFTLDDADWCLIVTGKGLPPSGVGPMAEGPAAAPPPSLADAVYQQRLVTDGAQAFRGMVEAWLSGFGDAQHPQPDRAAIVRAVQAADGPAVLAFVKAEHGLTQAVLAVGEPLPSHASQQDNKAHTRRAREVAMNIAQVASIVFPHLADTLEITPEWLNV